jgi:two-component system, NtrC family, response regulator GlrR
MTGSEASSGDQTRTRSRQATGKRSARRGEARLRVVYPTEVRASVPVGAGRVVVGRGPEDPAMPRIRHATVSRSHFAVEWDAMLEGHFGMDLGSRNGSWVDGELAIIRRPLVPNSVVRLGDILAVYETGQGLAETDGADVSPAAIPGESPAMRLLRVGVGRAAPDPSPVVLIGETGTGKEAIAAEIHRLSRRRGELIALNCAALSPQLVESQLFGHVKGAFTGAGEAAPGLFRAAAGGTLFLDEIGELPAPLQPKLLRAIQEGEVQPVGSTRTVKVDVRVIAATNRNLTADVESGAFRRDLYARLALWELHVPPLRERRGDLFEWIQKLHQRWLERRSASVTASHDLDGRLSFEADAAEVLLLFPWRDNLRGVDRLVHALGAAAHPAPVGVAQLPGWLQLPAVKGITSGARRSRGGGSGPSHPAPVGAAPAPAAVPRPRPKAPTRDELDAVLRAHGGSIRATAKHFGRDRRQIYRWIDAFGLKGSR